jgi:hypothetical protein
MAFPFGAEQTLEGVVIAEDVTLTVAGDVAAVAQQLQFTLNRTVNVLYEIGTVKAYYVGNRRQGQGQLNRVVAGAANFGGIVTTLGDMCAPTEISLQGSACKGNGNSVYLLKNVTLTSLGGSVTAQDIIITETLGFVFLDLDYI